MCRAVPWGPEVGAGERNGPGVSARTSMYSGIGVRVREIWGLVFNPSSLPLSTYSFLHHF